MFKHILIPTDGSPVAGKAVKAGLKMAKEIGAKVTGYCAIEPISPRIYGEGYMVGRARVSELEKQARQVGDGYLAAMEKLAKASGVQFDSVCSVTAAPYDGIVEAARRKKCDVIFMASHGRGGIAGLLLGSVAHKVLVKSKLPVLIYR